MPKVLPEAMMLVHHLPTERVCPSKGPSFQPKALHQTSHGVPSGVQNRVDHYCTRLGSFCLLSFSVPAYTLARFVFDSFSLVPSKSTRGFCPPGVASLAPARPLGFG